MLLKDKVAIITGAASGIGKATAITFGREGAKVMCADVNADGAEAVARQIADTGGEAASVKVDVVAEADVQRMIQDTVARWGRLDVIHNNAGIGVGMLVSVPLAVGISGLEIIVVLVQAYVFTLLSAVFIGMAIHIHH